MSVLIASFILAQGAPDPPVTDGASPMAGFAIMTILAIVVIGISLMPSKRSHQD
ncbi:MAG: hypothetical protein O2819_00255 [Planctomycetota bacterium]|nr:hypothetical protein [Planctomycetota bacterium]MDA1105378.1 hypothetical protein [Planctomycetota bacterium]